MTYKNFIKEYLGKANEYDPQDSVKTVQCVDLCKLYCDNVLNVNKGYGKAHKKWAWGNARDWFECFENRDWGGYEKMHEVTFRVKNTPDFVPISGDICFWTMNTEYGHVALGTDDATTNYLKTYDQNFGGKEMKLIKHDYKTFLGVLRPYRVVKADVNIRRAPDYTDDNNIVGVYKAGAKVKVSKIEGKWAKLTNGNYISANYLIEL